MGSESRELYERARKVIPRGVNSAMRTLDLAGLGVTDLEVEYARLCSELIPSVEQSVQFMTGSEGHRPCSAGSEHSSALTPATTVSTCRPRSRPI